MGERRALCGPRQAAYRLARALLPADAEQALAPGALPHVTLMQCALRDAPRERVAGLVNRLEARLQELALPLGAVAPSGGGFLFWCVDEGCPERARLQSAHEEALGVADGFKDPVVNARVVEATARATGDDPVLVAHARASGYAFAREAYRPHITLVFDARLAQGAFRSGQHPHRMRVAHVVLARLGPLGRVDAVLSL